LHKQSEMVVQSVYKEERWKLDYIYTPPFAINSEEIKYIKLIGKKMTTQIIKNQ